VPQKASVAEERGKLTKGGEIKEKLRPEQSFTRTRNSKPYFLRETQCTEGQSKPLGKKGGDTGDFRGRTGQ